MECSFEIPRINPFLLGKGTRCDVKHYELPNETFGIAHWNLVLIRTYSAADRIAVDRRLACASRTAVAAEARRVRSLSASLVKMIGTRAPSTIPAPSAPDMNVS